MVTLYHGTTKSAYQRILKQGLKPQRSPFKSFFRGNMSTIPNVTAKQVYLTTELEMARYYAEEQASHQGGELVVLSCQLADLDIDQLFPDDDELRVAIANELETDEDHINWRKVPPELIEQIVSAFRKRVRAGKVHGHVAYRGTISKFKLEV